MGERAKSVLLHPFRDSENLWLSKTPGKISKLYKVIGGDVRKADFFHVGLLIIVQGESVETHVHVDAEEFCYIIRGAGLLTGEDGTVVGKFGAGKLIYIPEGVHHGYVNNTTKPLEMLIWCSKRESLGCESSQAI